MRARATNPSIRFHPERRTEHSICRIVLPPYYRSQSRTGSQNYSRAANPRKSSQYGVERWLRSLCLRFLCPSCRFFSGEHGIGREGVRAPNRSTPLLFRAILPAEFFALRWATLPPPTQIATVPPGTATITAREGARSLFRATRSKELKSPRSFPVGDAASFIAAIPSLRGLTRLISCLPRRRGSKRIAAMWCFRSMADRRPAWMSWTTRAGMTLQQPRWLQISHPRATERSIWISPPRSHL